MPIWTHLIRFVAVEDSRIHLGQLVDTSRDVGLDSVNGTKIEAYLINGSIFDGEVTDQILTVKQILSPVSMEDCNYIRCLGLNYMDHAKVRPPLELESVVKIEIDFSTGGKYGPSQGTNSFHETTDGACKSLPSGDTCSQVRPRRHQRLRSRALRCHWEEWP
jgi:hypothetical protein